MFTLVMFVLVLVVVLVRAGARVAPDLGAQGRGLSVIVIALPGSLSCLLSSAGGAAAHSNVVIIHDDGTFPPPSLSLSSTSASSSSLRLNRWKSEGTCADRAGCSPSAHAEQEMQMPSQ
jgi:hypothetical protein